MLALEPKEMQLDGQTFIIHKFPAIAGREIIAKYPLTSIPKLGDYGVNEETMLKLMSYVSVPMPGKSLPLPLNNRALIDNHVKSWETLVKLEGAMLEYNCSFLGNGGISTFLNDIIEKLPAWATKTLMDLSQRSSQTAKPLSMN